MNSKMETPEMKPRFFGHCRALRMTGKTGVFDTHLHNDRKEWLSSLSLFSQENKLPMESMKSRDATYEEDKSRSTS